MIETVKKSDIQRIVLVEQTMRNHRIPINEGKEFVSVYKEMPESMRTTRWEIKKEVPEYGYKIVTEYSKDLPKGMDLAYTIDNNDWIGTPDNAKFLCEKRGIAPEKANPKHSVCSIGKSIYLPESEYANKYYGWSHRAIYGFGVGDGYKVKEGDCLEEYFPIGFEAKTEEDCRRMAIAFADSVS